MKVLMNNKWKWQNVLYVNWQVEWNSVNSFHKVKLVFILNSVAMITICSCLLSTIHHSQHPNDIYRLQKSSFYYFRPKCQSETTPNNWLFLAGSSKTSTGHARNLTIWSGGVVSETFFVRPWDRFPKMKNLNNGSVSSQLFLNWLSLKEKLT